MHLLRKKNLILYCIIGMQMSLETSVARFTIIIISLKKKLLYPSNLLKNSEEE